MVDLNGYKLTFDDEFNSRSISQTGVGTTYADIRPGWRYDANSDIGFGKSSFVDSASGYDPFNVQNGALSITAVPDRTSSGFPGSWESGLITTQGNFSQTYGYFEIRADFSNQNGAWDAFWMEPNHPSSNPSNAGGWQELDVVEHYGGNAAGVYSTIHTTDPQDGIPWQANRQVYSEMPNPSGYHTYGVNWQSDKLSFYVDGHLTGTQATPSDMHSPMYLMANLAVQDGATASSITSHIDYIRAYSNDPNAVAVPQGAVSSPDGQDPGLYGAVAATSQPATGATGTPPVSTSTGGLAPATTPTTDPAASTGMANSAPSASTTTSVTPVAASVSGVSQTAAPAGPAAAGTSDPASGTTSAVASSAAIPAPEATGSFSPSLVTPVTGTSSGTAAAAAPSSQTASPAGANPASTPDPAPGATNMIAPPPVSSAPGAAGAANPATASAAGTSTNPVGATAAPNPVTASPAAADGGAAASPPAAADNVTGAQSPAITSPVPPAAASTSGVQQSGTGQAPTPSPEVADTPQSADVTSLAAPQAAATADAQNSGTDPTPTNQYPYRTFHTTDEQRAAFMSTLHKEVLSHDVQSPSVDWKSKFMDFIHDYWS